jgi:hypothetical protein
MLDAGWEPEVLPGQTPALLKDGERSEPFDTILNLADGTLSLEEWTAMRGRRLVRRPVRRER